MTKLVLLAPTVLALFTAACADDPYEDGVELGEAHVELLNDDALTYARMTKDVEAGLAEYDAAADQAKFRRGYRDAVEPVEARILALVVEGAAAEAGEAASALFEAIGRDRTEDDRRDLKQMGKKIGKALKRLEGDLESVAEGIEEGMKEAERGAGAP